MKKILFVALALVSAAFLFNQSQTNISAKSDKFRRSERSIANKYIVVLNETSSDDPKSSANLISNLARTYRGNVLRTFTSALNGFSVDMNEYDAMLLSNDPRVKYVEEDAVVETQAVQSDATWGISRIDQRSWQYPLSTDYEYNGTGAGVNVYVVDSGILTTHPDFSGRAFDAANTSGDRTPVEECNGHGTHVAGTIGSDTFGVAKEVKLYSVRVFPCWGATAVSNVISGLDWVGRHAVQPAVVNMSLGGGASSTLDQAVQATLNKGITVVAAAGNSAKDACLESPARVPGVITVGMTDQRDYRDWVSNYGPCVDVFAPGLIIGSLWSQGQYNYLMSGTSAASPHAAGVAALYLQHQSGASPQEVSDAIVSNATLDVVYDVGEGSPNRFLFSTFQFDGGGGSGLCEGSVFDGSLFSTGSSAVQSSKAGFPAKSGMMKGRLAVPAGANFRLALEKKEGNRRSTTWAVIASSTGGSDQESIEYRVRNGTYRWLIESLDGAGQYSLCSVVP